MGTNVQPSRPRDGEPIDGVAIAGNELAVVLLQRRSVRKARRVVANIQRRHVGKVLGWKTSTMRGRRVSDVARVERILARVDPVVLMGAHVEAVANADLATIADFEAALVRMRDRDGVIEMGEMHEQVEHVRRATRGFFHQLESKDRRAFFVAMSCDPLFESVWRRVVAELPFERRAEAFAVSCKLRDMALANGLYPQLSSVCANAPCAFEEIWSLVRVVGGVSRRGG